MKQLEVGMNEMKPLNDLIYCLLRAEYHSLGKNKKTKNKKWLCHKKQYIEMLIFCFWLKFQKQLLDGDILNVFNQYMLDYSVFQTVILFFRILYIN